MSLFGGPLLAYCATVLFCFVHEAVHQHTSWNTSGKNNISNASEPHSNLKTAHSPPDSSLDDSRFTGWFCGTLCEIL